MKQLCRCLGKTCHKKQMHFCHNPLLQKKKKAKISFGVLSADTIGCHSHLSSWGLYIQYLQLCGLLIVICCILSRSLACGCLRSKCCQTSAALRLQGEQSSFNNVPLLAGISAKIVEKTYYFHEKFRVELHTEMSDLGTLLSTSHSTLFKEIHHLLQRNSLLWEENYSATWNFFRLSFTQ